MRTFRDGPLDDACRGGIWAIGNFDGLHRGHRALFDHARAIAAARGIRAGVLTFSPHPARVLNAAFAPALILTDDEKEAGIAAAGIDMYRVLTFDLALAALDAHTFARRILVDEMGAVGVVVGAGFRYGHRAAGTVDDWRGD